MKKAILIISIIFLQNIVSYSQNILKSFIKLSTPEKFWVFTHPFVAKKAYKISFEALAESKKVKLDTTLKLVGSDDKVDAFRHTYWMARLAQEFHWRKVYKLGKAHEKGNYRDYKKHRLEDGAAPDSISSEMDFLNNDAGRQIGMDNNNMPKEELIEFIKNELLSGELWIVKQNKQGEFIDQNNKIINIKLYKGKWSNPKILVRSDYIYK